ncbi:tripartite tricarboxylate transporter substrate binding protein [Hydrogenophaga sp.]|uniref:Bug family tripartite tricarboxylate transporter substrate binding protein n=1 Tax=Hydrogenophaga sp. TaxID=1904254 RepID=UPI0027270C8F|nr:tripartite tricarboxylate transporter substrate binding protein [Hydrogenophaga sp.]MDO9437519.1 tripartite tricarboxylate transporter substrate binding protein [Hydrogenophaga sp.]
MLSHIVRERARISRRVALCAAGAAALALAAPLVHAQAYPHKPIRVLVNSAPGGLTDVLARLIGNKMSIALGQPMVVENRTGGGGLIGAEAVSKADPDGYTIGIVASAFATAPLLIPGSQFDAARDVAPVALLVTTPMVLVTNVNSPYKTVADLVADAKARPKQVSIASGGNATVTHLVHEQFQQEAGIQLVHVPYKGGGPALNDVIAGHIPVYFDTVTTSTKMIQERRLRALALVAPQRLAALPDVPTIAEAGFPGVQASSWFAIIAPPTMPPAIIQRLNEEANKALNAPEVRDQIVNMGGTINGGSAQVLGELIRADKPRWSKLIKERGIKME